MLAEARRNRFTRVYALLDADGSGFIDAQDFMMVAERLGEARGQDAGSPAVVATAEAYRNLLVALLGVVGKGPKDGLDPDEWLRALEDLTLETPDFHAPLARAVFDVLDGDGTGSVTADEYRAFLAAHLVPDLDAVVPVAFVKLDTDQDGVISREEHERNLWEFFFSDSEASPGNAVFG